MKWMYSYNHQITEPDYAMNMEPLRPKHENENPVGVIAIDMCYTIKLGPEISKDGDVHA
jgi:hypothetical protein